ncbi:MAG TPA: DEAD/DEAH box helicase family protein [Solirubrobacteraceae bacterium]|jgi:hypothetical protein
MSFVETVGEKISFQLHPGQMQAWDSRKRFVAVISGTQSGKTSFTPLWLWREVQLAGPGDYGVICPTFALMEVKALPEFKTLFEQQLRLGTYAGSPVRRITINPYGERLLFGGEQQKKTQIFFGYAANPDSLESATYKAVVCDEAGQKIFKRGSWQAILRRLSIHQGRALITTTPYGMGGWLKTDIYDRWKAGNPDIDVIRFASTMNPSFPKEEFDRAARELPHWKFQLFYLGNFTRPAGLIYDSFDQKRHVIPRFRIPDEWPRFVGVDFGPTNTAAVYFAEELGANRLPTGKLFAYREYHPGKREPAAHAADMQAGEPRLPVFVGGNPQEEEWRARFRAAGLPMVEPPLRDVEVGIDAVYGCFCRNEVVIFDDLVELIDQLTTYSRVLDEAGEPTDAIEEKQLYHLCDAGRYALTWHKRGLLNWRAAASADRDATADIPDGVFGKAREREEGRGEDGRRRRISGGGPGWLDERFPRF